MKKFAYAAMVLVLVAGMVLAQRAFRGGYGGRGYWRGYHEDNRTPREIPQNGNETPTWTNAPGFEKDVFAFHADKREHIFLEARGIGPGRRLVAILGDFTRSTIVLVVAPPIAASAASEPALRNDYCRRQRKNNDCRC